MRNTTEKIIIENMYYRISNIASCLIYWDLCKMVTQTYQYGYGPPRKIIESQWITMSMLHLQWLTITLK